MTIRRVFNRLAYFRARYRLQGIGERCQAWGIAAAAIGVLAGITPLFATAAGTAWADRTRPYLAIVASIILVTSAILFAGSFLLSATDIARDWPRLKWQNRVFLVMFNLFRAGVCVIIVMGVLYASLIFLLSSVS